MREKAMMRIERILAAKKLGEMARLGAFQAAVNAALAQAGALRERSQRLAASRSPADMALTARWQNSAEGAARAAEAWASEIEQEAAEHRKALSTTIGREAVISRLIAKQRRQAQLVAARRIDDLPSAGL